MRFWKRCYIFVARLLLVLIEGPSRPWWAPQFMINFGGVIVATSITLRFLPLVILGACCTLRGSIWYIVRRWQINAVAAIARQPLTQCPFCKYSLAGVTEDKCPECGRKPKEDSTRLRVTMGLSDDIRKS